MPSPRAGRGARVSRMPQVCCRRKIPGSVYIMRNEEEQRAPKLLREYGIFFFFTIQGEIVWAEPIPVEARGVKGKKLLGPNLAACWWK